MEKKESKVLRCIWNIPICGGFCAPTKNPEPTALKHFSNEYTLPGSRVFLKVAPLIEQSSCCRCLASLGLPCAGRHRKPVMLVACAMSVIGWFLTLYPLLGLSQSSGLIKVAPWAKGEAVDASGQEGPLKVFIGLNARVDELDCKAAPDPSQCVTMVTTRPEFGNFVAQGDSVYSRTVAWSEGTSCSSVAGPLSPMADDQNSQHCADCRDSATGTVATAALGLLSQTVQVATDLQRSTRFGDVNCQANMGFLTSVFGFLSTMMTLRTFSQSCWGSLPTNVDGSDFSIQWAGGPAFFCLVVATVLKVWDAASHFILPAPAVRASKPETKFTDIADYMMLAVKTESTATANSETA